MKIWCDVCSKKQASVFCSADEAALCDDCDQRVHQANKLASQHHRFSLLQPSSSSHLPHCDICQEKKGMLFCQQDRAILCRDCDVPLHTSNELTKKHHRFLLTGAKLSALPTAAATTTTTSTTKSKAKSNSSNSGFDQVPDFSRPFLSSSSQTSHTQLNFKPQAAAAAATDVITITQDVSNQLSCGEGGSTSSISEYLIEMLPGWQVEDLLDSSSGAVGFSEGGDDDLLLFMNPNLDTRMSSYDNTGLWVPQAPTMPQLSLFNPGFTMVNGTEGAKGDVKRKASKNKMDDGFTVPQISPQSAGFKRFRYDF